MELRTLILLLPFAFTLHNFEEVLGMEKWTKSIPSYIHKPVTTRQFGIAVLIFSILGFAVTFTKDYFQSEKDYYFAIAGFAGMMFLNVLIPHLLATIFLKKYSPGVITALIINLPLTALTLTSLNQTEKLSVKEIIICTITGGVIGIILAYSFLKIGKYFDKDKKRTANNV